MGLHLKLGLFVVALVALVRGTLGLVEANSQRGIYLREMQGRALGLVRAFGVPTTTALAANDIVALDNYISQFADIAGDLELEFIAVLDPEAMVLAHSDTALFQHAYRDAFSLRSLRSSEPLAELDESAIGPVLDVAVPMQRGIRWGTLRARFKFSSLEEAMAQGRARLLFQSILAAMVAMAVAFWFLRRVVIRPVQRASEAASRIGEGDFDARVEITSLDELGDLGGAVNRMAEQLKAYTSELESLVKERTAALADANEQLLHANKQLEHLALTDPLTGLYNRRHFMDRLEFEVRRARRSKAGFALIMIDVDHFKHYNDTNGHPAGDDLLQRFAALLQLNLRSTDILARYGGEEFVVLLLDTPPDEGAATARKLREVIAAQPFPHQDQQPKGVMTASVGVAFCPQDADSARDLIDCADKALYRSKAEGRNRTTLWSEMVDQKASA